MIKKGDKIKFKPEWQDDGDELFTFVAAADECGGRVEVATLGTGLAITPVSIVTLDMIEA